MEVKTEAAACRPTAPAEAGSGEVEVLTLTRAEVKREDNARELELGLATCGTALKHRRPKPTPAPGAVEDLTGISDDDDDVIFEPAEEDADAEIYTCGYAGCGFRNYYRGSNFGCHHICCGGCARLFCGVCGGAMSSLITGHRRCGKEWAEGRPQRRSPRVAAATATAAVASAAAEEAKVAAAHTAAAGARVEAAAAATAVAALAPEVRPKRPWAQPEVDSDGVPEQFMCPISHDMFADPVIWVDGYTYSRVSISEWLEKERMGRKMGKNDTSPITGQQFLGCGKQSLVPNHDKKSLVEEWRQRRRDAAGAS